MTDRTLVVVRHSKAEPHDVADHERRLTARGRRDAGAAGAHLAELGLVPDHALVSTAARTRMTWAELAGRAGWDEVEVRYDRALYSGGPEEVLESLGALPAAARTVAYVGHNPTAADLAALLDDGAGDPTARAALADGLPTSGCAVFTVPVAWDELGPGSCRLRHLWRPRG